MTPLPVESIVPDLIRALEHHSCAVVQAPTGSGKTTRIPLALLQAGLLRSGQLVMLQPRRVAARASAHRMADLLGERVGQQVGYQIRFERRVSAQTRILVVTEGMLTRRFAGDPTLDGVNIVILDEFHERSIHGDLGLAFLHELLGLRDDLRVIIMSATLESAPITAYLPDCAVLTAEVPTHPLHITYLPAHSRETREAHVVRAVHQALTSSHDDGGDLLVFLPGTPEIRHTQNALISAVPSLDIIPFHGSLTPREQDAVLHPEGGRRIILATNLAETSLTVPRVTCVIDSGKHKILIHDPDRGLDRLDLATISRANADQRAGRAGRLGPGRVFRLWSEEVQALLSLHTPEEVLRTDLTAPLLHVLNFHGPDLASFPFFSRPGESSIRAALHTLKSLNAVEETGRLSPLGRQLLQLPLHPRLGRILERSAACGLSQTGARLCAWLNETDRIDLDQLQGIGSRSWPMPESVRLAEKQLIRLTRTLWSELLQREIRPPRHGSIGRVLLAGFPDRLCRITGPGRGIMVGSRGVEFAPDPDQDHSDFFLALRVQERGRSRTAARVDARFPVEMSDLEAVLALQSSRCAVFDETSEAVQAVRQVRFRDLLIRESPCQDVPPEEMTLCLARAATSRFDAVFQPDTRTQALLDRLRFAALHLPEEPWPDVSTTGLKALLTQHCWGHRCFAELRRLAWKTLLIANLHGPLRALLETEVPATWTAPTGNRLAVDYGPALEAGGSPVVKVKLQELFGLSQTPRLARGRMPILFHLLAPNMRPVQVTQDLASFWNTTYSEVRKQLRARYPKHPWPEDPWTAQPARGLTRPRRASR